MNNAAMNFGNAPTTQMGDFELLPDGTLAWAILNVKKYGPDNSSEDFVTPSKNNNENAYLNCELIICEGPYTKRRVFTRIGVRGNEEYVNQGRAAIRAILEVGRGANPTSNPNGYLLNSFGDLNGLKVAVKIKFEKGKDGYKDKNDVARWLTPNKESDGYKYWEKLLAGEAAPSSAVPSVGSVGQGQPAPSTVWGGQGASTAKPAAPTAAPTGGGAPAWLTK